MISSGYVNVIVLVELRDKPDSEYLDETDSADRGHHAHSVRGSHVAECAGDREHRP